MHVQNVHLSDDHDFTKTAATEIRLVAGLGVDGDSHSGARVQHRSRVAADPDQPNLRQVHLIHSELFTDLAAAGFRVEPGDLGENITTAGIDLLSLPTGATLTIGAEAIVAITGLRNPCAQIDNFQSGLLSQVLKRRDDGTVERLAGVMSVVIRSGTIAPGDPIAVGLPPEPHHRLDRV